MHFLVLCGLLNRVDDHDVDRAALIFQLQSKLLLNRREERWSVGIDRRRSRGTRRRGTLRQLITGWCVGQRDVVVPGESGLVDHDALRRAGNHRCEVRHRRTAGAQATKATAALTAHRAFGLRHLSRTDLIVDDAGVPWFLEVNVAPGMTETSLLPQSVEAAGLKPGELYRQIVESAIESA